MERVTEIGDRCAPPGPIGDVWSAPMKSYSDARLMANRPVVQTTRFSAPNCGQGFPIAYPIIKIPAVWLKYVPH